MPRPDAYKFTFKSLRSNDDDDYGDEFELRFAPSVVQQPTGGVAGRPENAQVQEKYEKKRKRGWAYRFCLPCCLVVMLTSAILVTVTMRVSEEASLLPERSSLSGTSPPAVLLPSPPGGLPPLL